MPELHAQLPGSCNRPQYNEQALASPKSTSIEQLKGSQLDQADASIWYQLVRAALLSNSGKLVTDATIKMPITQLFVELETTTGGESRRLLDKSLQRLKEAEFHISIDNEYSYIFQLLAKFYMLEKPKKTLHTTLGKGILILIQLKPAPSKSF